MTARDARSSVDNDRWEAAYLRFETPEEERAKFRGRLRRLGAEDWPRSERIADLFCGRGNGLNALTSFGFENLTGIDLSGHLLAQYDGPAATLQADCRETGLPDESFDRVIIQGGLHHLVELPDDLDRTLAEIHRLLAPGGHLVIVEPWLTPFLRFVHFVMVQPLARKAWDKLDALAAMTEEEATTYYQWLERPTEILQQLDYWFEPLVRRRRLGKLEFVGRRRPEPRTTRCVPCPSNDSR
ncbi:MAG: class I SAM-dependent methyltransferase [Xanthomonadales bacterium]|nr:class I SAM-dependent methyltransferase [Xanthomonadales bacterium]